MKNEAEGVTETAISILQSEKDTDVINEEIDKIASEHNMAIMVTDLEGNICYDAEYIATSRLNTMPKEEIERCLEQAVENGGSTKIEFEGSVNKTFPNMNAPQMPELPDMQNRGQDMVESVIYIHIVNAESENKNVLLWVRDLDFQS